MEELGGQECKYGGPGHSTSLSVTMGIHLVLGRINVRDASTRDRTTTRNISRHMSQYQVLGKAMVLKKSDFMFSVNKSHKIWWLSQWLRVTFRKMEGKENESKTSNFINLVFSRTCDKETEDEADVMRKK